LLLFIIIIIIKYPNEIWELIVFSPFLVIIMAPKGTFALFLIITSPRLLSGDVLLFYVSFSLLLLLLLLLSLLLFHTFLSARFPGDAFIKLYETL
jgi:hypothetical protein